jgi:hypothetical protein
VPGGPGRRKVREEEIEEEEYVNSLNVSLSNEPIYVQDRIDLLTR